MTVEDLIEALRELPQTARVEVETPTFEFVSDDTDKRRAIGSDTFDVVSAAYDGGVVTLIGEDIEP